MSRDPVFLGIASGIVIVLAIVVGWVADIVIRRRIDDAHTRFYVRKVARMLVVVVVITALAIIFRPFAGRIGVVIGLAAAGLAFAMQEVIGALAGWVNIVTGRIYTIGDRVQIGDVHGDVIDISLLRTTLLEIGTPDEATWLDARQPTGRVVTVSNKATFTTPVFNYSANFDYVWEELGVTVRHGSDWRAAERIMVEEVQNASASAGARDAMSEMARRYPVPPMDLEPRSFVRASVEGVLISARMVVPVRSARGAKDDVTRRVHDRMAAEGIGFATEASSIVIEEAREPGEHEA